MRRLRWWACVCSTQEHQHVLTGRHFGHRPRGVDVGMAHCCTAAAPLVPATPRPTRGLPSRPVAQSPSRGLLSSRPVAQLTGRPVHRHPQAVGCWDQSVAAACRKRLDTAVVTRAMWRGALPPWPRYRPRRRCGTLRPTDHSHRATRVGGAKGLATCVAPLPWRPRRQHMQRHASAPVFAGLGNVNPPSPAYGAAVRGKRVTRV